jgi:hypothetical protein
MDGNSSEKMIWEKKYSFPNIPSGKKQKTNSNQSAK